MEIPFESHINFYMDIYWMIKDNFHRILNEETCMTGLPQSKDVARYSGE
jgi:hypothetical protein